MICSRKQEYDLPKRVSNDNNRGGSTLRQSVGNENHLYVVPATNLLLVDRAKYSYTFDIRPRSDYLLESNELDQLQQ